MGRGFPFGEICFEYRNFKETQWSLYAELFLGLPQGSATVTIKDQEKFTSILKLDQATTQQILSIEKHHRNLDYMHKEVWAFSDRAREAAVKSQNLKTFVRSIKNLRRVTTSYVDFW